MRSLFVSLLASFTLIFVLAACGTSGSITLVTPAPEISNVTAVSPVPAKTETATASPSPSPTVDAEIEAVIKDFISAQNSQDWDSFLSLWTNEEQKYYKDFFAYSNNDKNKNGYFAIKSAKLVGIHEIKNIKTMLEDNTIFSLPYEIESGLNYDLQYKYSDIRLFITKADYELDKAFWDYREGINYRLIVLVPENGQWKVTQDYQGYPGAAEYLGDTVPDIQDEETEDVDEEENNLVGGTVHYTKKLECYFLSGDMGDYEWIGVRTIEGKEMWFMVGDSKIDPETLTRYQKIRITWQNKDVYIEEAEEVINEDIITDIKLLD